MFANACRIAHEFTKPVLTSIRRFDGSIQSGSAAYIVINDEGWIMTAAHLFNTVGAHRKHQSAIADYEKAAAAIEADEGLGEARKKKKIRRIKHDDQWITNYSMWWGKDGLTVESVSGLPKVDLAIGQIKDWDPSWISTYPTFKDPAKGLEPGTSLCRLGFPLSEIEPPTFDEATNQFSFSAGAIQVPAFPLDGLYTRTIVGNEADGKYPVKFLETSSPGLIGHSGGPIFDVNGTVWALQNKTKHYDLGFSAKLERSGKKIEEHQVLNAGWGAHPEVIVAYLRDKNIKFQISDH